MKFIATFILCLSLACSSRGAAYYISAAGAGSKDGSSAGNAAQGTGGGGKLYGSWSGEGIPADGGANTSPVHILDNCGLFTTGGSDGSWSGTLLYDADQSAPYGPLLQIANTTGLTVNGNGHTVSATANGDALAYQKDTSLIQGTGSSFAAVTIENLRLINQYVKSNPNMAPIGTDQSGDIFLNGITGTGCELANLYCSNASCCIHVGPGTVRYDNCTFTGCNHGLFPFSDTTIINSNFFIGDWSMWATTGDSYHGDCIIWVGGNPSTKFVETNCVYNCNMSSQNTGYLFNDGGYANTTTFANNLYAINNQLGNGAFIGSGQHFNETFIDTTGQVNTMLIIPSQYTDWSNCVFYIANNGNFMVAGGSTYTGGLWPDYNVYIQAAGTPSWQWGGTNYGGLHTGTSPYWAQHCNGGEAHSQFLTTATGNINLSTGVIPSGSALIGEAKNYVGTIPAFDITGYARPASLPWTVGAFEYVTGGGGNISVTVDTSFSSLLFTVDSTNFTTAQTFTWAANSSHTISTTSPQTISSTVYTWSNWSDSGAISHTITPSVSGTYTANFTGTPVTNLVNLIYSPTGVKLIYSPTGVYLHNP